MKESLITWNKKIKSFRYRTDTLYVFTKERQTSVKKKLKNI